MIEEIQKIKQEDQEILNNALMDAINNIGTQKLLDFYDLFLDYALTNGIVPIISEQHSQTISYLIPTRQVSKVIHNNKRQIFASRQFNIIGLNTQFDDINQLFKDCLVLQGSQYVNKGPMFIYKDLFLQYLRHEQTGDSIQYQTLFSLNNIDARAQAAVESYFNLQMFTSSGIYRIIANQIQITNTHKSPKIILKEVLKKIPKLFIKFFKFHGLISKPARILPQYYQQIVDQQLAHDFLQFLHSGELSTGERHGKIPNSIKTKDISSREDMYELRIMKYVYKANYGGNVKVIFANSQDEILKQVREEQRELFKKQVQIYLKKQEDHNCPHHQKLAYIKALPIDQKRLEFLKILKKQEIDPENIGIGYLYCADCKLEMICGHEACLILQDMKQYKKFIQATRFIDAVFNICTVCGIQVIQEGQMVENLSKHFADKVPKFYSIIWNIMNNLLKYAIRSRGIINKQKIFLDMVDIIYPQMKERLKDRKLDEDYKLQKMYHIQVLVCAYFSKLNGDNLAFSSKDYYNNIKNILTNYETFNQHIILAAKQIYPEIFIKAGLTLDYIKDQIRNNSILKQNCTQQQIEDKIQKYLIPPFLDMQSIYIREKRKDESQTLLQIYDNIFNDAINYEYTNNYKNIINQIQAQSKFPFSIHKCNHCKNSRYHPIISYEKSRQNIIQSFINVSCIHYCPETRNQHVIVDDICKQCHFNTETKKFIDEAESLRHLQLLEAKFILDYNPIMKYDQINEAQKYVIKYEYDELFLQKIAIKYHIQPIYLINYGGFDYMGFSTYEISNSQSSTMESSSKKEDQTSIFVNILKKTIQNNETEQFLQRKKEFGKSHDIKDLQFLEQIQCDWSIFSSRLRKIYQNLINIVCNYQQYFNMDTIASVNLYFSHLMNEKINNVVKCQIAIQWFMKEIFLPFEQQQQNNTCKEFILSVKKRDYLTTSSTIKQILKISKAAVASEQSEITGQPQKEEAEGEEPQSDQEKSDIDTGLMGVDSAEEDIEPEQ